MLQSRLPVTAIVSAMLVGTVQAEKANMSPEELKETATHVLTGQVKAIYQRTEVDGGFEYVRYVAEIHVGQCEKGAGIKVGDLVYVRYWRRQSTDKDDEATTTSGHRGLPTKRETIRCIWRATPMMVSPTITTTVGSTLSGQMVLKN